MHAEPCMAEKPPACRADAGLGAKRMHGPAGPRRATGRARTGRGGAPRLRQAKRWPLGGEAQVDGLGVGVERVVHAQVLYRQAAARGVVVALRGGSQDLIPPGCARGTGGAPATAAAGAGRGSAARVRRSMRLRQAAAHRGTSRAALRSHGRQLGSALQAQCSQRARSVPGPGRRRRGDSVQCCRGGQAPRAAACQPRARGGEGARGAPAGTT